MTHMVSFPILATLSKKRMTDAQERKKGIFLSGKSAKPDEKWNQHQVPNERVSPLLLHMFLFRLKMLKLAMNICLQQIDRPRNGFYAAI